MTTSLPEPSFINRDPAVILQECVAFVEARYAELGMPRVLLPTQPERVLIDMIVYRELLLRIGIQEAAKQNLRAFAEFPMLDFLAEVIGASRLEAQRSRTTERFTLPAPRVVPSTIDAGTRVRTGDGVAFETTELVTIAAGELTTDVGVRALVAGVAANGYAPGQVSVLVDDLGFECSVTNVTTTSDGSEQETTEQLRERMPLVVEALSVAGPKGAYRSLARAAHPNVLDAAVLRPADGVVEVVILSKTGVPSPELLAVVLAALDDEDVRPFTDTVLVTAAEPVDYEIKVHLVLKRNTRVQPALDLAEKNLRTYAASQAVKLRQSPVESAMLVAASVPGVHSAELELPETLALLPRQWARCTDVTVLFDGYEPEVDE